MKLGAILLVGLVGTTGLSPAYFYCRLKNTAPFALSKVPFCLQAHQCSGPSWPGGPIACLRCFQTETTTSLPLLPLLGFLWQLLKCFENPASRNHFRRRG